MNKHLIEITKLYTEQYDDYFGAKAGANSLAAVINGEVRWCPNNGCHGAVYDLISSPNLTGLFSSLWCRYEDLYEAAEDYWGYLLGPKGPWSKYMTDITIIKDEKGRSKAFGTFNTKQLANAWIPCMMQCRVPQESSNKLRSYWFWRQSGMDEPTSLYLSEHLALHITGYFSKVTTDYVHAFNWDSPGISLKRLRECDPIITNNKMLQGTHCYGPVNLCWTEEATVTPNVYGEAHVRSKLNPKPFDFKMLKGVIEYKGVIPATFKAANDGDLTFKKVGFVAPKEALKILKEASSWH